MKGKNTIKNLDSGQLDLMWQFLMMGQHKSNIPVLKENLDLLRQAMMQKDAGQRKDSGISAVKFEDIGTICNIIIIESMALYLSGDLDKFEERNYEDNESSGRNYKRYEKNC